MYDLTFELLDCPGLDSCSDAGAIGELPFASILIVPLKDDAGFFANCFVRAAGRFWVQ